MIVKKLRPCMVEFISSGGDKECRTVWAADASDAASMVRYYLNPFKIIRSWVCR